MIFEALTEAADRGELLLVDGGFCHWHLCRDGVLTIREIIVLPERRSAGIGSAILRTLCGVRGAKALVARCPADLPANTWYARRGFVAVGESQSKTGRRVIEWRREVGA